MRRDQLKVFVARAVQFHQRFRDQWVLCESVPLRGEYYHSSEPLPFDKRTTGTRKEATEGAIWGKAWESAWFRLEGAIPQAWKGSPVVAQLNLGGEICIFDESGCPVYGLSSASVFDPSFLKTEYRFTEACSGGEQVAFWAEAAANEMFGINLHAERTDGPTRHGWYEGTIRMMALRRVDADAAALSMDLAVAVDLIGSLPEFSARRLQLVQAVSDVANLFAEDRSHIPAMRARLAETLFRPACASDLTAIGVGHAHIDTGWLWPVRESIRKCARTFSSQVAMIERYPGYIFGASQAQHYQFVKEHYPALYEKIKRLVAQGRWDVQGGMWVEADCNIISGESMVRQFIHGKNFFRDEFGLDITTCWIPDVFGYSAAMPQIMKGCGVEFFLTQKISWSQFNQFPHHTFRWRGIDGSDVLTHFPPENNYNAPMMPTTLRAAQDRFQENHLLPEFMSLFGLGDGGGGPTPEHLERATRMQDLEGCPKVRFGLAHTFFERLKEHAEALQEWSGELYLELHRGTLTTQAHTKRNNRLLENSLRATEYLATFAKAGYPQAQLDRIWKTLLINQFHDIIPGSSIHKVYETTERQHAECLAECSRLTQVAAEALFPPRADALTLVNTLSEAYDRPIELPAEWVGCSVTDGAGKAVPVQHDACGGAALVTLAPQAIVTLTKGAPAAQTKAGDGTVLENTLIRYTFDKDGTLISAWDKELRREWLSTGARGNALTLYNDRPNNYDAWDVEVFYQHEVVDTARCTGVRRLADGPVRQAVRFEYAIGAGSTIAQDIVLAANSRRLEFRTTVEWNEAHRMLRVAFPVDITASEATYDIQYGTVRRPTHSNTSWDMAKFEVAAHTFADLSCADRGVAILNDCKYGHRIHENVLDLNLLRSPTYPDPVADLGTHVMTYALLPHAGAFIESDVIREAAMLNRPVLPFVGREHGGAVYPYRWEGAGVTLEVVKRAEKDDAAVVRLVERLGRDSAGTFTLPAGMVLEETNLIEWERGARVPVENGVARVAFTPFQIRTFRVVKA